MKAGAMGENEFQTMASCDGIWHSFLWMCVCVCVGVANFLAGLLKGYKYMEQRQSTLKWVNITVRNSKVDNDVDGVGENEKRRAGESRAKNTLTQQRQKRMLEDPAHFKHTMALVVSHTKCEICSIERNIILVYTRTHTMVCFKRGFCFECTSFYVSVALKWKIYVSLCFMCESWSDPFVCVCILLQLLWFDAHRWVFACKLVPLTPFYSLYISILRMPSQWESSAA